LELIGESESIVNVFKKLAQALKRDSNQRTEVNAKRDGRTRPPTFFITGETGTGKELVAHLIHRHSAYRSGPFVPINCSALPPDLAESELFGHEPGAFTGAIKEKKGLWELADGGTLFLDEITEAPRLLLPKLLRVLQEGTVKRLGSNRWTSVNVQVIAASNRDLKAEIEAGNFRQDLYHRLSLYQFHLPPLRERREDIPLLVAHFARRYSAQPVKFSQDALDVLLKYSWPGNVRELENLVRAAVTQSVDGTIYALDVRARLEIIGEIKTSCLMCGNQTELEGKPELLTAESFSPQRPPQFLIHHR
jgi:two-component system NtrC family response regulator